MQCPYCKQKCKPHAVCCPHCLKSFPDPKEAGRNVLAEQRKERKYPYMVNMLKNDWKILILIIILVLGIPALLSYNTSKKDETVIGQVKLALADGYADHEELSEVKWGRVNDGKLLLLKLSDNSKVRKEADILGAEIAARETGIAIVDAEKIIEDGILMSTDIEKGKKIKEIFTYVQKNNRYYQQANDVLPALADILDASLLARAKQSIAQEKIIEARNDLADISTQSPYAYQAKLVNNDLCAAEERIKKTAEINKRKQYAKSIEDDLLKSSKLTISVITSGDTSEYLTLKYKTLSPALLKKYVDENKIISTAQGLGFKRVTFDTDAGAE